MTEDERRRVGNTRRLVFENLANGVPPEKVMVDLRLSELEVDQARRFVAQKITQHLVIQRQPPIACGNLGEIRWNRRKLLGVLSCIGDLDLSTDLILSKMLVQAIDHPEMVEGAARKMAEARS